MVIDVHCHVGFSERKIDPALPRFSFEQPGSAGSCGCDSYLSPRLMSRLTWRLIGRRLGVDPRLPRGPELDREIEAVNARQWADMPGVDRLVLLAFDAYHADDGTAAGMAMRRRDRAGDLYVSNSLVRAWCARRPERFLFGASIHPYRSHAGMPAAALLDEVVSAGAVLVKWLPIHQNIAAGDPRTVDFLRSAARLGVAMLIHYGGEMSLARHRPDFADPRPLLAVLRELRAAGAMPTVIVAHVATPALPGQSAAGCRALIDALLGEFRDAPLYADISALAALGRTHWGRRLAKRTDLHAKLVWGSDYPIPVMVGAFWRDLDRRTRREINSCASWIERDLRLKRALGYSDCVFAQAGRILGVAP
jgi:predicted TIM-barrel fold metal-dependent hydrolase